MSQRNGSTRRWRAVRARVIRRDPLCQLGLPGCTTVSTTADHIVPFARGGDLYDMSNLRGACFPCNRKKSDRLDEEIESQPSLREW